MEKLFNDTEKISFYTKIQKELVDLNPNCSEEELNKIINQIPESYLNQKDELMMICQLFAYYPRNSPKSVRKNAINLFYKIMNPIKTQLKNESSFFWNIFGGLYYFKQIMYEEGLISITTIIQESLYDQTGAVAEYFLPEIIEYNPELFEKEFKNKTKLNHTKSDIDKYKELRNKHLKWLRESNDYNDQIYSEIETNRLRLSIKRDDIDTFQSILSNSNLSVDSKIKESVIENSYFQPSQVQLIDYAIEFNSIKIFKYLIMNDAKVEMNSVFNSIRNRNYEIIHLVESKNIENFKQYSLMDSISCWNYEVTVYSIENYDSVLNEDEDGKNEIDSEKEEKIFEIIKEICYSLNFQFFELIFLPILKKNKNFIQKNIEEIIMNTMFDQSFYFTNEFMKFKKINVNYHSTLNVGKSLLCEAFQRKNKRAIEFFLNHPEIDIINPCCDNFSPFQFACGIYSDLSVLKLFFNHSEFDIYWKDSLFNLTALDYCILSGNFLAIESIFNQFKDYDEDIRLDLYCHCLSKNYLISLKLILKHAMKKGLTIIEKVVKNAKASFENDECLVSLSKILIELNDDM